MACRQSQHILYTIVILATQRDCCVIPFPTWRARFAARITHRIKSEAL